METIQPIPITPILCVRCKNIGYYEVGISNSPDKLQMFCACENGRRLRSLSISWRLTDLKSIADNLIPRIKDAKNKLAKPDDVGKVLDVMLDDFGVLIKRIEDGLYDR